MKQMVMQRATFESPLLFAVKNSCNASKIEQMVFQKQVYQFQKAQAGCRNVPFDKTISIPKASNVQLQCNSY
jgi:hypothetical protein